MPVQHVLLHNAYIPTSMKEISEVQDNGVGAKFLITEFLITKFLTHKVPKYQSS
jgi:hypothetical protein